jgi:hypothetical protein
MDRDGGGAGAKCRGGRGFRCWLEFSRAANAAKEKTISRIEIADYSNLKLGN